jgi:hypothetical protein
MRKVLFVICLSVVAGLVAAGPASAGNPRFANIKTTATCTLDGGILSVDVGFVYSNLLVPGPAPVFSGEVVTLEKHVRDQPKWITIATLFNNQWLPSAPEPVDVEVNLCSKERLAPDTGADFSFPDGFGDANALRVVVTLTVANANPKVGTFTARCISFPPPECP